MLLFKDYRNIGVIKAFYITISALTLTTRQKEAIFGMNYFIFGFLFVKIFFSVLYQAEIAEQLLFTYIVGTYHRLTFLV